ncbi:chemotaxis protein CheB [Hymenobacter coccineus]|uniref:chemotaxis protein CheB n=1 Tax=Hymenobacter coccineus TaxID=1908235 RepID=UPI0009F6D244|nr:chemotaxis protein CheB [Hymenobacter coccineus]
MKHPLPPADVPPASPELDATTTGARARSAAGTDKFPVVALCGSAGSLEAFELFFGSLPARTGMAFVVVTHLGATPYSQLPQVLQNFTPLPVAEATDGLRMRPDHVYVIPPDTDLSLLHGCLLLLRPTQPPGHRLPIDFFLESLAKDAGARAVCVIFSGLGADGSVGLKAVMEHFGLVVAQDPATAKFDAMPRARWPPSSSILCWAPPRCPPSCWPTLPACRCPAATAGRAPPPPPSRPTRCKKSSCSSASARGTTSAFISATPCSGASSAA